MHQTHLPLDSDFSSDFDHFVLKILENLKMVSTYSEERKNFTKKCGSWGCPLRILTGETRSLVHPIGDAHGDDCFFLSSDSPQIGYDVAHCFLKCGTELKVASTWLLLA